MILKLEIPDAYIGKAAPLLEYLKSLEFVKLTEKDKAISSIPEWHKTTTLERIKNSKSENLLDWDEVKTQFKV